MLLMNRTASDIILYSCKEEVQLADPFISKLWPLIASNALPKKMKNDAKWEIKFQATNGIKEHIKKKRKIKIKIEKASI